MQTPEEVFDVILENYGQALFDIIKEQVPQPGQNPYATGRLKGSLRLYVRKDRTISIAYFKYGVYTDLGTYDNRFSDASVSPFGLPDYVGYNSNTTKGIAPQFWGSFNTEAGRGALRTFEENLAIRFENYVTELLGAGGAETTTTRNPRGYGS